MSLRNNSVPFLSSWFGQTVPTPITAGIATSTTKRGPSFFLLEDAVLTQLRIPLAASGALPSSAICTLHEVTMNGVTGGSTLGAVIASVPFTLTSTAAQWVNISFGAGVPLTAGVMYVLLIGNTNASPSNNYPIYLFSQQAGGLEPYGGGGGFISRFGARSETGLPSPSSPVYGYRLGFADGSYAGVPTVTRQTSNYQIYGARRYGLRFTTPAAVSCFVRAVSGLRFNNLFGSAYGPVIISLYENTTLVASTAPAPGLPTTNISDHFRFFSPPVQLQPATDYRVAIGLPEGSSAHYGTPSLELIWDTDPASLALKPFGGTAQLTYFDGTAWTDTPHLVLPVHLLSDEGGPSFAAVGGAGSVWGSIR